MTQENQKDKLKQVFAKRVTTQARVALDIYQKCRAENWQDASRLPDLLDALNKLDRYAARFEMSRHKKVAVTALEILGNLNGPKPEDDQINELELAFQQLNECTQRKSDSLGSDCKKQPYSPRTYLRTPVYLALNDSECAARIVNQLEFFGFRSISFTDAEELIEASRQNKPETIVADVDFTGDHCKGIEVIGEIQANHETPVPIIYVSERLDDMQTRLAASRTGGEEFFFGPIDPGQLIEKIELYTHASPLDPYRVLIVDDSRSQSKHIENILQKAGMIPCVITDPMQVLIALGDFQPEIIMMDMYMPGCTGMELARVIRQQDKFHSVPIIYLSAEDDVNKQLHAMSLGGDDFLTKPINPRHLTATIHNRGRRARTLLALMIRDSLTGLFNHTHTLHLLDIEISRARQKNQPLCFAMLDIDYFKKINDNYGHPVGDRVLKSLSLFLKQRLRKTDHIGRYGGEEFAIVLTNTSEADAHTILDEIRERFHELPQPAGSDSFQVSFSCGIAGLGDENAQKLCERADQALYAAKHDGRNNVKLFTPDLAK